MTPEGLILDSIMGWLAAKHILAFRMLVGGAKVNASYMRFGVKGMADILAFPKFTMEDITRIGRERGMRYKVPGILWIEVKTAKGVQSEFQKSFQAQVEAEGHRYILARSIEDVEAALK
jgi:hypothetical protein